MICFNCKEHMTHDGFLLRCKCLEDRFKKIAIEHVKTMNLSINRIPDCMNKNCSKKLREACLLKFKCMWYKMKS